MLTNRNVQSMDLDEELQGLGMTMDASGVTTMATTRTEDRVIAAGLGPIFEETREHALLGESSPTAPPAPATEGEDPIDGKYASRELLRRMVDLPFDQMTESDLDELITKFGEKELPEGDDELANLCEMMAAELIETRKGQRQRRRRNTKTGKMQSTKRSSGKTRNKARIKELKGSTKLTRKKRGREIGKGKDVQNLVRVARKTGGNRATVMARGKGKGMRKESNTLANELRSLLDESRAESTPFSEAQDRIHRVFSLIAEMADDDGVTEALEDTWEAFTEAIVEDAEESDFMEAVKPCLRVIKRCLEDFEDGDLSEAYGKKGKGKKAPPFAKKDDDDDDEDDDEGND